MTMKQDDRIPRRNRLDLLSEPEKAINKAIEAVENMGADEKLTDAIVSLNEAFNAVADYVDIQSAVIDQTFKSDSK